MDLQKTANVVWVKDPFTQAWQSCEWWPKWGWLCGVCGRGWVTPIETVHCPRCAAEVVSVELMSPASTEPPQKAREAS